MKKKIVVFGGSFNPPTKAHLDLGLKAVEYIGAERLCFVPVGDKYNKNGLIHSKHRVDMLDMLAKKKNNSNCKNYIDIDLTEVSSNINLNTIDTLRVLSKKYPSSELYFLLGADNLNYLSEWHEAEDILSNYKILAIRRYGMDIEEIVQADKMLLKHKDNIVEMTIESELMISSTIVRKLILENDNSLYKYLDKDIIKYIKDNKLYID